MFYPPASNILIILYRGDISHSCLLRPLNSRNSSCNTTSLQEFIWFTKPMLCETHSHICVNVCVFISGWVRSLKTRRCRRSPLWSGNITHLSDIWATHSLHKDTQKKTQHRAAQSESTENTWSHEVHTFHCTDAAQLDLNDFWWWPSHPTWITASCEH